jgi:hypothetical protein
MKVLITFVCMHAVPDGPPETRATQMSDGEYGLLCETCTRALVANPGRAMDWLELDQPFEHEVTDEFWNAAKTAVN